jgi:hypothetical protein
LGWVRGHSAAGRHHEGDAGRTAALEGGKAAACAK